MTRTHRADQPARVEVALGPRSYPVLVGRGLLGRLGDLGVLPRHVRRAAVVTQPPVAAHHLDTVRAALADAGLEVHTIEVPDGEQAKTVAVLAEVWERLAAIPLERRDLVVALGGGVVGDLAGFAAATWHRGVAVLQLPTTLLAQVDAAIGGKTAIDLPAGKNLVGAFHQPVAVVCDVDTLGTLPRPLLVEGLAEVVKYGLIRDPAILDLLETGDVAADRELHAELVRRSAAVKAAVVAADEREHGERAHLNLGHTVGHALEAVTGYRRLRHGEAVAIGTCAALRIGVAVGRTPAALVDRTETLLDRLGLPTRGPAVDRGALWAAMRRDKKTAGEVRFVLLRGLADPVVEPVPPTVVDAVLDEVLTT